MDMKIVRRYDPLDQTECLETHLRNVVLKNYEGSGQDACLLNFFILNAEVLNEMKFGVPRNYNSKRLVY